MKRLSVSILCLMLLSLCAPCYGEGADNALSVFEMLQAGDAQTVYAKMNEDMAAVMPPEALDKLLPQLEAIGGAYEGYDTQDVWEQDGYRVTVLHLRYANSGFALRVVWQEGKIAGLFLSPEAKSQAAALPQGIIEEEITIGGDSPLPGTLTLPASLDGPVPAVVLVHGSGPNDRDETSGNTKLFRDIAWALAERGIAVLRYDKRTYVYGGRMTAEEAADLTVREETISDAIAAGKILRADARVSGERVYLCGHSMGAMLAPRTALEAENLFAGLILLSGTPETLADVLIDQLRAAYQPLGDESLLKALEEESAKWEQVRKGDEALARSQRLFGQTAYYFWEMAQYDTVERMNALQVPVLIINGGADVQVTDENGVKAWEAASLPANVKNLYYPQLDHYLTDTAQSGAEASACVYQGVIDEMETFILAQ